MAVLNILSMVGHALASAFTTCAVLAGLWALLLLAALSASKRLGHGGHWWGKYVLGCHYLLQPPYLFLEKSSKRWASLFAFPYQLLTLPFGMELPLATLMGRQTCISHTSGIVFHRNAVVGNGCTFHSGVVLGGTGRQNPPKLGNNIYIGANVVIAGDITIGDNATIGAGAVVLMDVPANALVLGNPATIAKDYYQRPYCNSNLGGLPSQPSQEADGLAESLIGGGGTR